VNQQETRQDERDATCMGCMYMMGLGLFFGPENGSDMISKMFTFNRLHNITSQTTQLFITVAVRTSNPTKGFCTTKVLVCKDKFIMIIQMANHQKKKIYI
jgi:hypothetical protein